MRIGIWRCLLQAPLSKLLSSNKKAPARDVRAEAPSAIQQARSGRLVEGLHRLFYRLVGLEDAGEGRDLHQVANLGGQVGQFDGGVLIPCRGVGRDQFTNPRGGPL